MVATKTIVFDLDDTICYPNHSETDSIPKYGKAVPNTTLIAYMKRLKEMGYHITICSARRMVTHSGDIDKIVADIGEITINWLKQYNVPYDDLHFGKPYSSTWYVDDKAMDVNTFYKWADYEVNCMWEDR